LAETGWNFLQIFQPLTICLPGLETKLTNLGNERDASYESIWDQARRARMEIKVFHGDDSSRYETAGGTRQPLVS
jgi:hypothetical protein